MSYKLMYTGITHEKASVSERAYYSLDGVQKEKLIAHIETTLQIKGIFLLTTCNRTEIYFESRSATPDRVSDILLQFVEELHGVKLSSSSLTSYHATEDTVEHLLQVSSGLKSAVLGDGQIFAQMRDAYKETLAHKRQGTLLERAFQSVFRNHKKITKAALLQSGSSSTAYLSLKLMRDYFQKQSVTDKKILLIGAGDMIQDVLKYIKKFGLTNVYIANRTEEKALKLAQQYHLKVYDWQRVVSNRIESFDAVISAVGNQKHLIKSIKLYDKKRIWIDLAVPFNIDKSLANNFNAIYDIDFIGKQMSRANEVQSTVIPAVKAFIKDELDLFMSWFQKYQNKEYLHTVPYKRNQSKILGATSSNKTEKLHPQLDLAV